MRPHVLTRQGRRGAPGAPGASARRELGKAKVVTAQCKTRKLYKKLAKGTTVASKVTPEKNPPKNVHRSTKNIPRKAVSKVSQKPMENTIKTTSGEPKKELRRSESRFTSPDGKSDTKPSEGKVTTTIEKKKNLIVRKATSRDRKKEIDSKKNKANTSTVKNLPAPKPDVVKLKDMSEQKEIKKKKEVLKTVKVVKNLQSDKKDCDVGLKTEKISVKKKVIKQKPTVDIPMKDVTADTVKDCIVQKSSPIKKTSERLDSNSLSKNSKDRARSPEKRKRFAPLRSSSAPLIQTSDNNKTVNDEEQSKTINVSRSSKLTSENATVQSSQRKVIVVKKGNKLSDKAKDGDASSTTSKTADEKPFNQEPSNMNSCKPSDWLSDPKSSVNVKDSGILMKMPFLDSQLVSPLGRKKLVGKVKPIARVKGTVIESAKLETDKKVSAAPVAGPRVEDTLLRMAEPETSEKLKIDSDKKKFIAVPTKPIEELKKCSDSSKNIKSVKKIDSGKLVESGKNNISDSDNSVTKIIPKIKTKKNIVNPSRLMNKGPKIGLIKGRPIGKTARKIAMVKGVKLAKTICKISQTLDKKMDSNKDSASSSDEVTYSFPKAATGSTDEGKNDQNDESKGAILKTPKVVKSLPKKIRLVKNSKKNEKSLNVLIKSDDLRVSEEKQHTSCDSKSRKSTDESQKLDDLNSAPLQPKNDSPTTTKSNADVSKKDNSDSQTKNEITESLTYKDITVTSIDPKENISLDQDIVQLNQEASLVFPKKTKEIHDSSDENSESEERFAFPNIKSELKTSRTTSPRENKKKTLKLSPKPVKKFISIPTDDNKRRMRLLGFWTGPKKHREASLNAQAKVQCLYENESRTHLELGLMRTVDRAVPKWKDTAKKKNMKSEKRDSTSSESEYEKKVKSEITSSEDESNAPTRTLRYQPTGSGKYWEMKLSSSEESEAEHRMQAPEKKKATTKPKIVIKSEKTSPDSQNDAVKVKKPKNCPAAKRRNRTEVVMDLRDMVVRKRMASLNATAMLAASYEKRSPKSNRDETTSDSSQTASSEQEEKHPKKSKIFAERGECSSSRKDFPPGIAEASAATKSKMAVIVNQEADVTITGVYTHTGYCTVSEMQYRISATSHTQTTATAANEKEVVVGGTAGGAGPGYTPLGALSSMHPPGGVQPHLHPGPSMESRGPLGGALGRRAGCSSAFSAPPHHHPDTDRSGYYQPAGPLISAGPLHGGFKGAEGTGSGAPPPPQDNAYSRYPYSQPQQVMHYGGGFGASHPQYGGYGPPGRLGAMGAPAAPPAPPAPPACYRAPPAHRPPPSYRPPPPDQGSPAGGEAYAPQYCAPCYQHPHVPPRPAVAYLDSAYQGCPCPMQSCPKNVHTGPVTGNPPASGGPGKTSPPRGGGGTGSRGGDFRRCSVLAPSLPPEALGPPSPARGSAGLDPPHPPRRARLGKAMARKSIAPGDTSSMLLACRPGPSPPAPPVAHPDNVKSEADSGDEVILLDSPGSKMAPIDVSSSEENCPDNRSEKDCVIVRHTENEDIVIDLSSDTKKENTDTAELLPARPKNPSTTDVQALKEHNVDSNVVMKEIIKKSGDVKPKAGIKRRCSKLEIDMEVDLDDSLAANGIGEHVKLQKRQKVSITDLQAPKKTFTGSYKDLIKKNDKVFKLNNGKRQLNTVKTEKCKLPGKGISLIDSDKSITIRVVNKRKSTSPSVRHSPINKRKRFGSSLLKLADKRSAQSVQEEPESEKHRESCKKSLLASIPKSKSVTLLDDLIMKNNLDRVIESVVKNAPVEEVTTAEPSPAALFSNPSKGPAKASSCTSMLKTLKCSPAGEESGANPKGRTVLNINNNVVKKVNEVDCSSGKAERKLSTEKRGRTDSKSPGTINRISEKKQKETTKIKNVDNEMAKDSTAHAKADGAKAKKATTSTTTKSCAKSLGKRKGKSTEASDNLESAPCLDSLRDLPLLRRGPSGPKWSNGWTWEGEPQYSKVYINNEENCIWARCWVGMRHSRAGDSVRRGDSVLLRAGARRSEPPFVARVSQLWENPTDGEMMVSLLWYYRPEHTERGRQPEDCMDEVFASRHRDANSVACIEDKCYVLTYNEYCRYRKRLRATEDNVRCTPSVVPSMPSAEVIPALATNDSRLPPDVSPDLVLFCRRVYDFRLKKVISAAVKGKAYYN